MKNDVVIGMKRPILGKCLKFLQSYKSSVNLLNLFSQITTQLNIIFMTVK